MQQGHQREKARKWTAMASADLREELLCSICLTTYTDPVMLRCGHNFCRVCIDRVLDTQDGSGVYSCPECREEFQERPTLMRNRALRNIIENLRITQPTQTETGIFCTYCVDSPLPAVISCLLCEASLCDKHLRVHSKSAEHLLSEPRTSLENRKCSVHKKILKYYCIKDAACICVSCSLIGQHSGHKIESLGMAYAKKKMKLRSSPRTDNKREKAEKKIQCLGHKMESLDEAYGKKKRKLRNVFQQLITKRKKTEGGVQSLEERRRKAPENAAGLFERVTALCKDIMRQLDNLKKVQSEITRREKSRSHYLVGSKSWK